MATGRPKSKDREYEAYIEERSCGMIQQKYGLFSVKLAKTNEAGYPDRMILMGNGRVLFMEFKRPGEKVTPKQALIHKRLRHHGFTVHVVTSVLSALQAVEEELEAARLSEEGGKVAD